MSTAVVTRVSSAASLGSNCSVHFDVSNARKSSTALVPAKILSTSSNSKVGKRVSTRENLQVADVSSRDEGIETVPVFAVGLADKTVDNTDILINTMQLAEPHIYTPVHVPDHLLETKIYSTLGQNSVVQAKPSIVNFAGFEVGKSYKQRIDFVNASSDVQRLHVIPPQTKYFRIAYTKRLKMVPGLALCCHVEFYPDECRYYYDCIRIHCKGDDNLVVPIHAYPVLNTSDFPSIIDFSLVPVGEMKTRIFPLRSVAPTDFEFSLTLSQSQPFFTVDPLAGVVPANGEVDISVTYRPTSFQTATAKLKLDVKQFSLQSLICKLIGRAVPGLKHDEVVMSAAGATAVSGIVQQQQSTTALDPGLVGPLARSRTRRKAKIASQPYEVQDAVPVMDQRDGLLIPANLENPHAVSSVLNQKSGQLAMKHLQAALQSKTVPVQLMSRQMKEAQFLMSIRQNVFDERQNQLRWQLKHGDEPASTEFQLKVIEDRLDDWRIYKKLRGDTELSEEIHRTSTDVVMKRTYRSALWNAPEVARFDAYSNNLWAARHRTLTVFQQAARKVIVRNRMMARLEKLYRSLAHNVDESLHRHADQRVSTDEIVMLTTSRVLTSNFPVYNAPIVNDDLAVDALGSVSLAPLVTKVEPDVPYFALQVPQQAKLLCYGRFDIQEASLYYEYPVSYACLRVSNVEVVAELDNKQPSPSAATQQQQQRAEVAVNERLPSVPVKQQQVSAAAGEIITDAPAISAAELHPPGSLFKSVSYPPLHIFNPAPGLATMLTPLPYSETDADFHVCPLPRFPPLSEVDECAGRPLVTTTQRRFLDRQEIIKGVMTWKKFPSPSVLATTNVPTLSNVWVPRWHNPFNEELLPTEVPSLKSTLDADDLACLSVDDSSLSDDVINGVGDVQLSMQMVKAEFAAMEASCFSDESQESTAQQSPLKKGGPTANNATTVKQQPSDVSFPNGTKMPATNLPSTDCGPVSRSQRENDLKVFLSRKGDILGQGVRRNVEAIDQLTLVESLRLK